MINVQTLTKWLNVPECMTFIAIDIAHKIKITVRRFSHLIKPKTPVAAYNINALSERQILNTTTEISLDK